MNWKLTRDDQDEPMVVVRKGNTQMTPVVSVLEAMALDPQYGITRIRPGVYVSSTDNPSRRALLAEHEDLRRRYAEAIRDDQDPFPGLPPVGMDNDGNSLFWDQSRRRDDGDGHFC